MKGLATFIGTDSSCLIAVTEEELILTKLLTPVDWFIMLPALDCKGSVVAVNDLISSSGSLFITVLSEPTFKVSEESFIDFAKGRSKSAFDGDVTEAIAVFKNDEILADVDVLVEDGLVVVCGNLEIPFLGFLEPVFRHFVDFV